MWLFRAAALSHAGPLAALCALAVGVFLTTPTAGDFWWFDASRHAMNAVFVRDFFLDGGLTAPLKFARDYYAHTPAINIGFYPPLFYFTAAPVMAVAGASHAAAQAVVAAYAAAAGVFAYLIALRGTPRLTATALAASVMLLPGMALWSRQVQLDVPAIAWLLASAYGLVRYRENGGRVALVFAAVALGLAIQTRVQAVFAVPVFVWALWPATRARVWAVVGMGVLGAPALVMTAWLGAANGALISKMPGMPAIASLENWLWYAKTLPGQMGWPALALVGAGGVALLRLPPSPQRALSVALAVVALSSAVFFTLVSNKDARFNLPALPFLLLAAGVAASARWPRAAQIGVIALCMWLGVRALTTRVPAVEGFAQAAQIAAQHTPRGGTLLVSAHRDGNFIFNLRTAAARGDIPILRADKWLVEINVAAALGVKDAGLSADDIAGRLSKMAVSTLVVQSGYLADQPTMNNFERMLRDTADYQLVSRVPITGDTLPGERELRIYTRRASRGARG